MAMKNQVMVWLAAASLHHRDRAPFQRHELMDEIRRLFPKASSGTITTYVDQYTQIGGSYYSFAYLLRTGPGTYRLSRSDDENPLGKPRWPSQADLDPSHMGLWEAVVSWQRCDQNQQMTALQALLLQYLIELVPAPIRTTYEQESILVDRDHEISVRLDPEYLTMKTMVTQWTDQVPRPLLDRELTVRTVTDGDLKLGARALAIIALVQSVFGPRLASYSPCLDCGSFFPPEYMTESCCHDCASRNHGVIF